jgi:alkanesulfonate monooxygenase SsuD/methylene tetrahydromethanopterin reductase-like flavin-dependent oxidoreductase (luciferase family)
MKDYRDDIRRRAAEAGRNSDDIKLLYIVSPVLGATDEEAQAKAASPRMAEADSIDHALGHMSALTEIDFSQFPLDEPLPTVETNGHRTTLSEFARSGDNGSKTLREIALGWNILAVDLVGSVETVADKMGEVMEEVGGDGFLISGPVSRQYIGEITDGLVPALQRRGLTRTDYTHEHFRDNLLDF